MENIRKDNEIVIIEKKIPELAQKVQGLEIKNELGAKGANDLSIAINKAIKKLEEKRKFFVQPLNDHVKQINAEFQNMQMPLKTALQMLKTKLGGWYTHLQEKARKEAEIKQKQLSEKTKASADFLKEKPVEVVVEPEKPKVVSSLGASYTKKRWVWEPEDETKIPREYLIIDERKINAMVRANTKAIKGVNTCDLKIPGIKIYQKEEVALRG